MQNLGNNKNLLILGATSAIAISFVQQLVTTLNSCKFYLLARNIDALKNLQILIERNGHEAFLIQYDLIKPTDIHFINIHYCIIFAGYLPTASNETVKTMQVNFIGIKQFIEHLIEKNNGALEQIIITGSIAGVRIRNKNKDYCIAKNALHGFAYELQRKYDKQFTTTLIIPGYIKTKMVANMKTPRLFTIQPDTLATKYIKWMGSRPKRVYSQSAWRLLSAILQLIPESIFRKINF